MAPFQLHLLGGFELRDAQGRALRLPTRKAEALLARLALDGPGRPLRRESLAALLWPDAGASAALASLRQCLSLIGKTCGAPLIRADARELSLGAGSIDVDLWRFADEAQRGTAQALAAAATLYRGEMLAGLNLGGAADEEWLQTARRQWHARVVQALADAGALALRAGDAAASVAAAERLLELEPLHEGGHRLLMQALAEQGRRAAALRQYQVCVQALQRELGAEPEAATRTLYHGLVARAGAAPAAAPRVALHESPLIGREAEQARLQQRLDAACAGHGQALALLGDAGVGKTRLADELAAVARAAGLRLLCGPCHESQQVVAYAPWVEALRSGGAASDAALAVALGAARSDLAALLPELQGAADTAPDELAAAAREARLFGAVQLSLAHWCGRGPVLLVLEDLHWCDELSLRLLAAVVRRARAWPLLVLMTAREEELEAAAALRRVLHELDAAGLHRLSLSPLTRPQTDALVAALYNPKAESGVAARLADRVWAASEGNPFVAVEAVRAMTSATTFAIASARSAVNFGGGLPTRVHEMIVSQVERLGADARRMLSVLAVAGRDSPFALLQRASALDAMAAAAAIEELVRRRLVRLVGENFDVLHARVRQAVLATLLAPVRRGLHLALAEALAEGEDAGALESLAHHYAQTHRHDQAVHWLVRLATRLAHDGAHGTAIDVIQRALEHAAELPPGQAAAQRRDLLLRRARALFFLGRFAEVMDVLLPLEAEIDAAGEALTAAAYYLRRGSTHTYLGRHAETVADARRALHEAESAGDAASQGKAHFLLSLEHFWAQPVQGVIHGEQAVTLLQGTPERWWTGQACWILGLNLSYVGCFDEGLAAEERASQLADALGDRRLASYAAWTTGFIHTLAGRGAEAIAECRRSLQLAVDPLNRMTTLGILALALVEHGDADEALVMLAEAIPQALRFRIPQMEGLFLGFRAQARSRLGELDLALADARQGVAITDQAGYVYGRGWSERVLARVLAARGDRAAAVLALERAERSFAGMGAPYEAARTRTEREAWSAAAQGGRADAGDTQPGSA